MSLVTKGTQQHCEETPIQRVFELEDYLVLNWAEIVSHLKYFIAENLIDIDHVRITQDFHQSKLQLDISPVLFNHHAYGHVAGARIYAKGIGQTDEYQAVLMFDGEGKLNAQIATKWISAFRTGCIAALASELLRKDRPLHVCLRGLGRMGISTLFVLAKTLPIAKISIAIHDSKKWRDYYCLLVRKLAGSIDIQIVENADAEFLSLVSTTADSFPIFIAASNRKGMANCRSKSELYKRDTNKSRLAGLVFHIGSKYGGDWDGPECIDPRRCNVLTDSQGQFGTSARNLAFPDLKAVSLQTLLSDRTKMQGLNYLISVGSPGIDVFIADLLLGSQHYKDVIQRTYRHGCG
jgi:hypothetical protein